MILSLEDFAVICGLLSPVYYLAWLNNREIGQIKIRLAVLEEDKKIGANR